MKKIKCMKTYDPVTYEKVKEENIELDIVDAAGVVLEEGQKVWYARASKSAPSELFKAEIVKLTPNSVTLEYKETHWDGRETLEKSRLTSGYSNCRKHTYMFQQIAII